MNYVTANWGHPWIAVIALVVLALHENGLRNLNRRSTRGHATKRRRKMWLSYAGLLLLTLSIVSPLEFWSMQYFWVHMLQHISVMLAAPALYVAGAPAVPLLHSVPVGLRRRVLRHVFVRKNRHPIRRICALVLSPAAGIISFNAVMVLWMVPSLFNPVMANPNLHIGLMLSTFFVSGLLFWIQFIPSGPMRPTLSPFARAGALLATNLIMTVIAIAISLLVAVPSYRFMVMTMRMGSMVMPLAPVTLNRLADQQIGAAILWVCGDFWCLPALFLALRSGLEDETASELMDRLLRGRQSMSAKEFQSARSNRLE